MPAIFLYSRPFDQCRSVKLALFGFVFFRLQDRLFSYYLFIKGFTGFYSAANWLCSYGLTEEFAETAEK